MSIVVGSIIKDMLEQKGMSKVMFAKRIHTSNQNVHSIFKRSNFDTDLLTKISKVLDHDFFQYYKVGKTKTVLTPEIKIENTQKVKFVIELEIDSDDILKLGLREKLLEIIT